MFNITDNERLRDAYALLMFMQSENYKLHRNDPKPPKLMKPLAPVSAAKKQHKKAPKK